LDRSTRVEEQFAVDLGSAAVLHAVFGGLDRIGDRFAALFLLAS
jgi:hypothetical protein